MSSLARVQRWVPNRPRLVVPGKAAAATPPVAGYVTWIDWSDTSSITSASNLASQIADKGSGAQNLSASGAQRPTTGVDTINSLNVGTFDGSATRMTGTTSLSAQPWTVFLVAKNTDTGSAQRDPFVFANGGADKDGRIYRDGSDNINGFAGNVFGSGYTWGTTNAHSIGLVGNTTSSKMTVDSNAATSGSLGTQAVDTVWTLGAYFNGNESWKGLIGEVIIYASALSDANVVSVMAYLKAKWATP